MKHPLLSAVQRGRLFALGACTSFGVMPPLARIAYDTGASPGMVIMGRLLFGVAAAGLVILLLNRPWRIPRSEWLATALIACGLMAVNVGYMASFYFIPVSLAVLIFFTFPVLIALLDPVVSRRRPEPLIIGAAVLAFSGLVLALGPDLAGLDWRGIALALVASAGATSMFLLSHRLVREQDLFSFSFHLHLACVIMLAGAWLVIGPPQLPSGVTGWSGLAIACTLYSVAILLQFAAIRLAGPSRTSVVFNAEPVITMVGAAIVLGELLGSWQITGAALVITAVVVSTRADRGEY